tara:strand:+ start:465 stop:671 length:207 start_codon:yes stop_codon:yes gene_type:complete
LDRSWNGERVLVADEQSRLAVAAVAGDALVGVQLGDVTAAFGAGFAALVMHLQKIAHFFVDVHAYASF